MGRMESGSNAMVIVQMTVEEYLEMKSRQEANKALFGCSTTTAWRIKNSSGSV